MRSHKWDHVYHPLVVMRAHQRGFAGVCRAAPSLHEVAYMRPVEGDDAPPPEVAAAGWVARTLALAGPAGPPLAPGRGLFAMTAADPPGFQFAFDVNTARNLALQAGVSLSGSLNYAVRRPFARLRERQILSFTGSGFRALP